MERYKLLYNKTSVILIAVLGMSLVYMFLFLGGLFYLAKNTPDWIIWAIIFSGLIFMIFSIVWVLTKQLTTPCTVTMNENGISFELEKRNLFYRLNSHFSGWENVDNISETLGNGSGNFFYQVKFKNPNFTANFSPIKTEEADAEKFFATLSYYQDSYNLSHALKPINSKSFYDTFWARSVTWLFYIMVIVIIILAFTTSKAVGWWRTVSVLCFGSIWVANYYHNTKKLY